MKTSLDKLKKGKRGIVYRVNIDDSFKIRLLDLGITPGTGIILVRHAPLGDPIQLLIRGYCLSIRKETARKIEVLE